MLLISSLVYGWYGLVLNVLLLVCFIFLFLYNIIILLYRFFIVEMLWLINIMVILSFCWSFLSRFRIVVVIMVFSVDVILLYKIIVGLVVRVWVRLICCFCLFDSVLYFWWVKLVGNFINFNNFVMCFVCVWLVKLWKKVNGLFRILLILCVGFSVVLVFWNIIWMCWYLVLLCLLMVGLSFLLFSSI